MNHNEDTIMVKTWRQAAAQTALQLMARPVIVEDGMKEKVPLPSAPEWMTADRFPRTRVLPVQVWSEDEHESGVPEALGSKRSHLTRWQLMSRLFPHS